MDLNELLVFARVARTGSFTSAARELGMPKSTVSRKVSELEQRLNARLLQRTTRKLSLTDVGRTYYDYCARIVAEVEEAERAVSNLQAAPRGLLRVTSGSNAAWLGPIVSDFMRRYPEVRVELLSTGRTVDLVEERFDLGIRAGPLSDSSLIAKSLGQARWFLVATRQYLKRRGKPRTPEDLKQYDYLAFGEQRSVLSLRLEGAAGPVEVALSARLLVSDFDVLYAAAAAGLGIALLPAFRCGAELREGRFERVLRDWDAPSTPMHVVYPSTRHVSPKVTRFIDHLQARLTPPPWELDPVP